VTLVNIGVGVVKRMKVKTGGSRILSHWEEPEKGIPGLRKGTRREDESLTYFKVNTQSFKRD
jgi:hypothetical protein